MVQADSAPPPMAQANLMCISEPASRGGQIAAGIACCEHEWIWVLHADSSNIDAALAYLLQLSCAPSMQGLDTQGADTQDADTQDADACCWGRFDVHIDSVPWVAWLMNLRSRIRRICTGDQAMFFTRTALQRAGGYPQQPLMEDIEVSKRLRRVLPQQFLAPKIVVSTAASRWRLRGWLPTVLSMWRFRLRYFFGASPQTLYRDYYADRRQK